MPGAPDDRARLASVLVGARRDAGLTQTQAAAELAVDVTTLGRWERGQTAPDVWAMRVMSQIYRVNLWEAWEPHETVRKAFRCSTAHGAA